MNGPVMARLLAQNVSNLVNVKMMEFAILTMVRKPLMGNKITLCCLFVF